MNQLRVNLQVKVSRSHRELFRNLAERRGTTEAALMESLIDREVMWEIERARLIERAKQESEGER